MDYPAALQWLYGLQMHGIKLGLENMYRLCAELGIDVESGADRKFIHVAGTNGKGSVCAMIAAICCAAGKRTGLYTSPHLVSFRERICLGANRIPEEHVAEHLSKMKGLLERWDHTPTFFEVTTALALSWFQQQKAEWIILETGLGGRLDATNVVKPVVSVITPLALDHTQYLGSTLEEVATEKAGIIKRGVPVMSAPQDPEAEFVLQTVAKRMGSALHFARKPIADSWQLSLAGSHQRYHAALAFSTLVTGGLRPDPRAVGQALSKVEWPGRFQRVEAGHIILDGAHNPAAAAQLVETWRQEYGEEQATIILGVLADKDVTGVCNALRPIAARVICVPVRNPRGISASDLSVLVRSTGVEKYEVAESLTIGLDAARRNQRRILIAGSLFLVGQALVELGLVPDAHEWSVQ
jgi:dihydrofolate synthase/folylpolyglutamate synthase